MNTIEYFKNNQEKMPKWLKDYKKESKLNMTEVLKSRVVYYPGAYVDGQPIRTYNKAHFAHVFFYVDYMPTKEQTLNELQREDTLTGYELYDVVEINEDELTPNGWRPHYTPTKDEIKWVESWTRKIKPYCYVAIFNRKKEYDESHGNQRICLIYLFADGIATYDAVFANYHRKPAVLILQDHGFGGNYNKFGKGGAMHNIAKETETYPDYILCEDYGNIWDEYKKITSVEAEIGGMHSNHRYLFKRKDKLI